MDSEEVSAVDLVADLVVDLVDLVVVVVEDLVVVDLVDLEVVEEEEEEVEEGSEVEIAMRNKMYSSLPLTTSVTSILAKCYHLLPR